MARRLPKHGGLGHGSTFPGVGVLLMPIVLAVAIANGVRSDRPAERVAPTVVVLTVVMLAVVVHPA